MARAARKAMPLLWMPSLHEARGFIKAVDGVPAEIFRRMGRQISEAVKTAPPKSGWRDPALWIPELVAEGVFDHETEALAWRMHRMGANAHRATYGRWLVRLASQGVVVHTEGKIQATEYGKRIAEGDPEAMRKFCEDNGVIELLRIIADRPGAPLSEVADLWADWASKASPMKLTADDPKRMAASSRIMNILLPMGWVRREGHGYAVTDAGRAILEGRWPSRREELVHLAARVGEKLGYRVTIGAPLRDLLPERRRDTAPSFYDRRIDLLWSLSLPVVGEVHIPVEVHLEPEVTELVPKLAASAPHSVRIVVIADMEVYKTFREHVEATGQAEDLEGKVVFVPPEALEEIARQIDEMAKALHPREE